MDKMNSSSFNASLDRFNSLLLDGLASTQHPLRLVNNYVRTVSPGDRRYLFTSLVYKHDQLINFTVSYDEFYTVPVLYLQVVEGERDVRCSSGASLQLMPHPLFNEMLWLCVHPCETRATMEQFKNVTMEQDSTMKQDATTEQFKDAEQFQNATTEQPKGATTEQLRDATMEQFKNVTMERDSTMKQDATTEQFKDAEQFQNATMEKGDGDVQYLVTWFNTYGLSAVWPDISLRVKEPMNS